MRWQRIIHVVAPALVLAVTSPTPVQAAAPTRGGSTVSNVFATTQRVSCYTPEAPIGANDGPNDGYSGETACPMKGPGAFNTGENLGPYPTQAGSNPGYPASGPMLVKDHSESDIRVDPTNPLHLIGSSKWFVSAEGYNHLLGFYESFDGGTTWNIQGHIPGYEGWTDNTDPVGAFDGNGDFYELVLAYQFFYNSDGSHNFAINQNKEPNPSQPPEVISVAVRQHGATGVNDWITTRSGQPDFVAPYPAKGQEPDKQWITIDTNPSSKFYNTIYAMWAVFDGFNSKVFASTAKALGKGQHTDWTTPVQLPTLNSTAADSYLLPHVAPDGVVYTSVTNFPAKGSACCVSIAVDSSANGGVTWQGPSTPAAQGIPETVAYPNTTFRQGISNSFAVGNQAVHGNYPLYVAYEDFSTGNANSMLTVSMDRGVSWSTPIRVNDNTTAVDEFQPNLAVADNGTVSVNFYDRRWACPAKGSAEAAAAGLALDQVNPAYSGSLPPYSATNYCVNASIQFYKPNLQPIGSNIRISLHTFDPQLNSPHPGCPTCTRTFLGDYFGNTFSGNISVSSFVSTYDDGTNPAHRQQQVVAEVAIPSS